MRGMWCDASVKSTVWRSDITSPLRSKLHLMASFPSLGMKSRCLRLVSGSVWTHPPYSLVQSGSVNSPVWYYPLKALSHPESQRDQRLPESVMAGPSSANYSWNLPKSADPDLVKSGSHGVGSYPVLWCQNSTECADTHPSSAQFSEG